MLLGMAFAKRGYFSPEAPAGHSRLLIASLLLSLPLMLLVLLTNRAQGFSSQYSLTWGMQWHLIASGLMAVAYALLISCWARVLYRANRTTVFCSACGAVLIAVGRMALSVYILQTLIFTSLFFGYGLGWYGRLSLTQLMLVIVLAWLFLCVFSVLWLRYFPMGPLEWLWRRFIYGSYPW